MKRDMDLIRQLLSELERDEAVRIPVVALTADEENVKWGHLKLMEDDGLIEFYVPTGKVHRRGYESKLRLGPTTVRMTSRGHAFLDGTRAPDRWESVKGSLKKAGITLTVEAILWYIK